MTSTITLSDGDQLEVHSNHFNIKLIVKYDEMHRTFSVTPGENCEGTFVLGSTSLNVRSSLSYRGASR